MVTAEIRGVKFPLCLTAAAVDDINDLCGGIDKLGDYISGSGAPAKAARNIAVVLGILVREGEENRLVEARFSGEKTDRIRVPSSDDLKHLLTPAEAIDYRPVVLQAISESLSRKMEAEPSKNAVGAERQ